MAIQAAADEILYLFPCLLASQAQDVKWDLKAQYRSIGMKGAD